MEDLFIPNVAYQNRLEHILLLTKAIRPVL
jgi:hypothetical protein